MTIPISTDLFLVNRNDISYYVTQANLMAQIQDDDLMLINRADASYKITGLDAKTSFVDPLELVVAITPNPPFVGEAATAVAVPSGGKVPTDGWVFSYQWKTSASADGASSTNIAGATSQTYTPVTANDNLYLGCTVSTTDALGTFVTTTSFVGPVDIREIAPQINTVTLTDLESNINRYTSSVFPYEVDMAEDGEPDPTYAVKAKLTGVTFNFGVESDTITAVTSTAGTQTYKTDTIANVGSSWNQSQNFIGTGTQSGTVEGSYDWDGVFNSGDITSLGSVNSMATPNFSKFTFGSPVVVNSTVTIWNNNNLSTATVTLNEGLADEATIATPAAGDVVAGYPIAFSGNLQSVKIALSSTGNNSFAYITGIQVDGFTLVNAGVPGSSQILTFPTDNNFDRFEVGDVVQGGTVTNLSESDYNDIFGGTEPNNSYITQFGGFTVDFSGTGFTGNTTMFCDLLGVTGTFNVYAKDLTTVLYNNSIANIESGTTDLGVNFEDIGRIEWAGNYSMSWFKADGVYVNPPLGTPVSITAINAAGPTMTTDGGSWYGADGSGDTGDGRYEPSEEWSDNTLPGAQFYPGLQSNAFDGSTSTQTQTNNVAGAYFGYTFSGLGVKPVRVHATTGNGSIEVNGSVIASASSAWVDCGTIELTSIKGLVQTNSPYNSPSLNAVEVDGKLLVDSSISGGRGATTVDKNIAYAGQLTVASDSDLAEITGGVYMTDGTIKTDGSGEFEPADYTLQTSDIVSVVGQSVTTSGTTPNQGSIADLFSPNKANPYAGVNDNLYISANSTFRLVFSESLSGSLKVWANFASASQNNSLSGDGGATQKTGSPVDGKILEYDLGVVNNLTYIEISGTSTISFWGILLDGVNVDAYSSVLTFNTPNPDLQYFQVGDKVSGVNSGFNPVMYTGNGGTQSITGVGFSSDLVWIKSRTGYPHKLFDTVRGPQKYIESDLTVAETTSTTALSSFDSDGFTIGSLPDINYAGDGFVAWCWDAGDTTVTNNEGSLPSQVRSNGNFSVITYTGNSTDGRTVGHGLSGAPAFIISKRTNSASNWAVYHASLGAGTNIRLDEGSTAFANNTFWGGVEPNVAVYNLGVDSDVNASGNEYVSYAWAETPGVSKFGAYNGGTTTSIDCGFKPAFVMIKCFNNGGSWFMFDSARNPTNPVNSYLMANSSEAEDANNSSVDIDFTDTGFTLIGQSAGTNENNGSYIYAAFAGTYDIDVVSTDVAANTMTVDNSGLLVGQTAIGPTVTGTGTIVDKTTSSPWIVSLNPVGGRWIGPNKAGTNFKFAPVLSVVDTATTVYCKMQVIDDRAEVMGIQTTDPGFLNVTRKNYDIQFPALFTDGDAPDTALPPGTELTATVKAENNKGDSVRESNTVMPLALNPADSAGPITAATATTLTTGNAANLDTFVANDALKMVDDTGAVASYTPVTSTITSVVSNEITVVTTLHQWAAGWTGTVGGTYAERALKTSGSSLIENGGVKFTPGFPLKAGEVLSTYGATEGGSNGYVRVYFEDGTSEFMSGALPNTNWNSTGLYQQVSLAASNQDRIVIGVEPQNNPFSNGGNYNTGLESLRIDGSFINTTNFGEGNTLTFLTPNPDLKFFNPGDPLGPPTGFNPVLYTGNGGTQSIKCGFSPDLVWVKSTSTGTYAGLGNTVVGPYYFLIPSNSDAQRGPGFEDDFVSFDSDGFTLGADTYYSFCNRPDTDYVAWCWDAGDTTVTNNDGTIASQVRSNSNFSVITYTGTGDAVSIGHGLSTAPKLLITKNISRDARWIVYHFNTGTDKIGFLDLDSEFSNTTLNGTTAPTESIFNTGGGNYENSFSGDEYVTYAWAETAGISNFGGYTGNDGTQSIDCGFEPAWVMIKCTSKSGTNWVIYDSLRGNDSLSANTANTNQDNGPIVEFTSTGFQVSNAIDIVNSNSQTYIYAAFAGPGSEGTVISTDLTANTMAVDGGDYGTSAPQLTVATGPAKSGTGTFVSTNGTDSMTITNSNLDWISNDNRLSQDFYVQPLVTRLNSNNPAHVALQQAIVTAFSTVKTNSSPALTGDLYRLLAGETLTAAEIATLTDRLTAATHGDRPFHLDGYYPLYYTAVGANAASPTSSSHTHVLGGNTYYMPDGVTIYHGTYVPTDKTYTILPHISTNPTTTTTTTTTNTSSSSSSSSGGGSPSGGGY